MKPLPPIKARIVAAVFQNRECDADWLFWHIYGDRRRLPNRHALTVHIAQLRKLGFPIVGTGRGRHPSRYVWDDFSEMVEAAE